MGLPGCLLAEKKESVALPAADAVPVLGAPLVTKLDWNLRSMSVADLDGDGRNDLVVLNNDTGRIELLYQRKPGETGFTELVYDRKGRVVMRRSPLESRAG